VYVTPKFEIKFYDVASDAVLTLDKWRSMKMIEDDLSLLVRDLDKIKVEPSADNDYRGYVHYYPEHPTSSVNEAYIYDKYAALTAAAQIEPIHVYRFSPSKNFDEYGEQDEILKLGDEVTGANFFLGIKGKFLFYDEGTSTGPRGLGIVNLENQREVYSGTWKGGELEFINDHTVKVYEVLSSEADEQTSGQHVKMQAYSFDLQTLKLKKLEGDVFEGML
jgi:hypothetical protein